MKKNDWILIIATALYSYLFYNEAAGINFFIFSIGIIILLLYRDPSLSRDRKWVLVAGGTIVSGAAVALFGNWLSLWANCISLGLLSAMSMSTRSSVIMALFHSAYSVLSSVVFMIIDAVERKPEAQTSQRSPFYVRLLLVLIPLLITLLFFFLYRGSNPIFNNFAKNIHLDFITWGWIFFTLLGFIILYGFFYHRRIKELAAWDENAPMQIAPRAVGEDRAGGLFSIRNQHLSGMLLFAMLNILLLVVNTLDLQYVYISKTLPPGLTHSENVHQGVELLILSIIIAIAIILFVFRGDMNFYSKNRMLRLLAYAWIIQNMFMVVSTIMRNNMYVGDHGLTYKRIGVYVYLTLALIGLITTWIKIMKIRSNWFLFRINTGVWYLLLVITALINWDKIIVDHNITHARGLKSVDKNYLIELGSPALPAMLAYNDTTDHLRAEYTAPSFDGSFMRGYNGDYAERTLENKLHYSLYRFFEKKVGLGWQSWNYDDSKVKEEIARLSNEGKIKHLSLGTLGISSLEPLRPLSGNITSLDLRSTMIGKDLRSLNLFAKLQKLNLSSCGVDSLDDLPSLSALKELDLSMNQSLRMLNGLMNTPALSSLNLASCGSIDVRELPVLDDLADLDLSGNTVSNVPQLNKFRKLEKLMLRNASVTFYTKDEFPVMPSLHTLDVSGIDGGTYASNERLQTSSSLAGLLKGAARNANLETLDLSGNNLLSIREIADPVTGTLLVKLRTLSLQNNRINDLSGIEKLSALTALNISYNSLLSLAPVTSLPQLKMLYAAGTPVRDPELLARLSQLEHLDVSSVSSVKGEYIRGLTDLKWLNVSGTGMTDVSKLRNMVKLESLFLQNNQVESIEGLQRLGMLKMLNISGNRIKDHTPLYELKQLKELYIDPVSKSTMDDLVKALPNTKISVIENAIR